MQSFKNLFGGEAHITKMNSIDVITLDHIEDSMESNKPYMDCTLVVQNMVNQSQLHISGGHSKV